MKYPMRDCGHVAGVALNRQPHYPAHAPNLLHDWVKCELCGQTEIFPFRLDDAAFFVALRNGWIPFSRAELGEDNEGQAIVHTGWYVHPDGLYYPFAPMTEAEITEANISIARIESNNEMQDWDDQRGAEEKY